MIITNYEKTVDIKMAYWTGNGYISSIAEYFFADNVKYDRDIDMYVTRDDIDDLIEAALKWSDYKDEASIEWYDHDPLTWELLTGPDALKESEHARGLLRDVEVEVLQ